MARPRIWWYILSMRILVEPISSLKRAAAIIKRVQDERRPLVITQNGRAAVVVQDIESFEQREEALALLKVCLDGERSIAEGRGKRVSELRKSVERRVQELVGRGEDE